MAVPPRGLGFAFDATVLWGELRRLHPLCDFPRVRWCSTRRCLARRDQAQAASPLENLVPGVAAEFAVDRLRVRVDRAVREEERGRGFAFVQSFVEEPKDPSSRFVGAQPCWAARPIARSCQMVTPSRTSSAKARDTHATAQWCVRRRRDQIYGREV